MWFYRFRIFGLRFKKPLKFRDLLLYTPQDYNGYSFLETTRRFKDTDRIKQKVERLLELLQIFYLTWVTYFGVYQRKRDTDQWQFVEATSTFTVPSSGQHPLFDEIFLNEYLEQTFDKRRFTKLVHRANVLLIDARMPGMLFESRFLLRWIALESILQEYRGLWRSLSNKQIAKLRKTGMHFANAKIKSKGIKKIFLDKIDQTRGDMTFQKAFKKFAKQRKLPVTYEDIADCKKIRDKIVHYGSFYKVRRQLNINSLINRLEALVRNIIVYYLGLKFDPEWKKWRSRSLWQPQRR